MSEQIDFFALMQKGAEIEEPAKEETKAEEPQKEEIKEAEVVEKQPVEKPKKEIKKEAKKGTKKTSKPKPENKARKEELKPISLEEQIATVPDNLKTKIDVIYRHLMSIPGMDEKMRNPNKTITDMFKYIENEARKQAVNGCAMIEDQEVFGWAVHYYDEENPE